MNPISLSSFGYVDVLSTVSQIMGARNTQAPALNATTSNYQASISTYAQLKSAFSAFQAAVQPMTGNGFNLYKANSSIAGVASATTSTTSAIGTYGVQVNQLATSQTLVSAGQVNATTAIGSGATTTLTFQFGTTAGATFTPNAGQVSKTVTITNNNSLQGIASAINAANVGVTAGVNFNGTTYSLTVQGNATGASNSMSIGVTGDVTLQNLLNNVPGGMQNMTQSAAAQNALVSVNGVASTTPTNTLVGAIPGTTLTVAALGTTNMTVAPDVAQITSNATNFVKAYNTLVSTLGSLAKSDPSAGVDLMKIRNQMSRTLNSTQGALAGSPYTAIAQVGITTQANGTLALNTATFQSALGASLGNVAKIFTNNGSGIADTFVSQANSLVGGRGLISAKLSGLNASVRSIGNKRIALSSALTNQTQGFVNQYTNLNLSLARWQQNGSLFSGAPSTSGLLNLFV